MTADQMAWLRVVVAFDVKPASARRELADWLATLGDCFLVGLAEGLRDEHPMHCQAREERAARERTVHS